ncbi:hypothetical protein RIF29_09055 [Crotalaria pallida]|uniref:CBS domain-containing protein n=1 Tax=Crotalaria pallida TaxID=3830 RepID=A0AAN9FXQ6_CROPI
MVLLVFKTVEDAFDANIYDLIMKAKGFPYLETHAEPYMRQLTVGEVVTGPLQIFHAIEKVRNIVFVLKTMGHNGFPVIDEPPLSEAPVLFGIILRDHLLTLNGSSKGEKIEDIQFTEEEMDMFIDLHPFTNASPYTVVETMSLGKALTLFREVGLRHLLVIPKISGCSCHCCYSAL